MLKTTLSRYYLWVFLLICPPSALLPHPSSVQSKPAQNSKVEVELRNSVNAFWAAWQAKDYQKASLYVIDEQRRQFMRVRKFPVRKWEIQSVELQEKGRQAQVQVKIERFEPFMGAYIEWKQKSIWLRRGSSWLMEIPEGRPDIR